MPISGIFGGNFQYLHKPRYVQPLTIRFLNMKDGNFKHLHECSNCIAVWYSFAVFSLVGDHCWDSWQSFFNTSLNSFNIHISSYVTSGSLYFLVQPIFPLTAPQGPERKGTLGITAGKTSIKSNKKIIQIQKKYVNKKITKKKFN